MNVWHMLLSVYLRLMQRAPLSEQQMLYYVTFKAAHARKKAFKDRPYYSPFHPNTEYPL